MVFESFHPVVGGGEAHGKSLAEALTVRGTPPLVITLRNRPGLAAHEQVDGYEVHRVGGSNRWLGVAAVARKLSALRDSYDVVYVSPFRAFGAPLTAQCRARHVPIVLQAQNNGEFSGAFFDPGVRRLGLTHRSWPLRPLNALRQAGLRRADRFVAVSGSVARELETGGVPPEKIERIPFGIRLDRFHPAKNEERQALRARLALPPDATIVCFTGRLVTWKGPLTLLEAWARLPEVVRARWGGQGGPLLLFLGAGGSDRHNCEARAHALHRELELGETVRFVGDVTDVHHYLRASDVFALPTEDDLFPVAMLEAMACGLPVVTTLVGGLEDYVEHEANALVVLPRDPATLAGALARLMADARLRAELGTNAARTGASYSREAVADQHIDLFRSLLPRARK